MNIKEFGFNTAIATVGTVVSAWLGGWDIALNVLVVLMILDYVTGLLGAVRERRVNSEIMFWGGIRKGIILAVVALAVMFDQMLGNPEPILRTLAIYFYAAREGISVTENLGIIGVPLPPVITRVLEQLQSKGESTK
jgi:toxin secretion/phage lysis holin